LPSQIGQRLAAPAGVYLELLRISASSRPCVGTRFGARLVFAVAVGAKGHMQPPQAKQRTSAPAQISFVEGDRDVFQTAGLVAVVLDLFNLDRGHPVTCNRLFRSAARLGGGGLLPQSYVGKRVA